MEETRPAFWLAKGNASAQPAALESRSDSTVESPKRVLEAPEPASDGLAVEVLSLVVCFVGCFLAFL